MNVEATKNEKDVPIYSDGGVDLTLIRWMLNLSLDERLQHLEAQAAFLQELMDAPRVPVSNNTSDAQSL